MSVADGAVVDQPGNNAADNAAEKRLVAKGDTDISRSIAVIGGGWAGCTAAVELARAQQAYDDAFALLPRQDRRAQRPGLMMAAIYRTLLDEVQADGYHVLTQRISLTPIRKLWLAWKTYVRG